MMVNSFYDPDLEHGCASGKLISFHGGLGGPQAGPFVLAPVDVPVSEEPIVGAVGVHGLRTDLRSLVRDVARPVAPAVAAAGDDGRALAGSERRLL